MTGVLAGPGSFHNRRHNRQWQASDSPYTARPVQFRTALKSTLCGKKSVLKTLYKLSTHFIYAQKRNFPSYMLSPSFPFPCPTDCLEVQRRREPRAGAFQQARPPQSESDPTPEPPPAASASVLLLSMLHRYGCSPDRGPSECRKAKAARSSSSSPRGSAPLLFPPLRQCRKWNPSSLRRLSAEPSFSRPQSERAQKGRQRSQSASERQREKEGEKEERGRQTEREREAEPYQLPPASTCCGMERNANALQRLGPRAASQRQQLRARTARLGGTLTRPAGCALRTRTPGKAQPGPSNHRGEGRRTGTGPWALGTLEPKCCG